MGCDPALYLIYVQIQFSNFTVKTVVRSIQHQIHDGNLKVIRMIGQGRFREVLDLASRVAALARRHLVADDPSLTVSLANLAGIHEHLRNYAVAITLYQEVLAIRRETLGEKDPTYATTLNNLAVLYHSIDDYPAAESLHRQANEIWRLASGEDSEAYAMGLLNLSGLYYSMGDYGSSEAYSSKALKILGEDHPIYIKNLSQLARLYIQLGDHNTARSLYNEALDSSRNLLGEDHPEHALNLLSLANIDLVLGNHDAAESLCLQVDEILRKAYGEEHRYVVDILSTRVSIAVQAGRAAEALPLMEQMAVVHDRLIGQIFSISSEEQRLACLSAVQWSFEGFLTLVSCHLSSSPKAVLSAFDLVLRRKAIGAEALAAQRDAVLGGKYPTLQPKLHELVTLRSQIAEKTLAGPEAEDVPTHYRLLAEWNTRKEKLEAELAKLIPEMNLEQKLRAANRQAVALALPQNSVLVEYVRFDLLDTRSPRYLAFVLTKDKPDRVHLIELGDAEPIDRMLESFRRTVTGEDESRSSSLTANADTAPIDAVSNSAGNCLRELVFDPLLPFIGDCKRLLLSPDGDLNRLPFEVLPDGSDHCLIDDYQISYLGSGRDVLRFGARTIGLPTAPLVIADPDFNLTGLVATAAPNRTDAKSATGFWSRLFSHLITDSGSPEDPATSRKQTAEGATKEAPTLGRFSREINSEKLFFGRLPGTLVEGQCVSQLLGVIPLLSATALESRLKACRSPLVLHLATHGFFLPDRSRAPHVEQHNFTTVDLDLDQPMGRFFLPGVENPMLRSGLALAGVNTWLRSGVVPPEAEDGILTAEDVSGLDLTSTELTVLSACETGLGDVRTGEGVFGLRRAFTLAGARTLMMSLWKVPDLSTTILMERLYTNLFQNGMPRDESLREAQLYTRELTLGELRRTQPTLIDHLAVENKAVERYYQRLARKADDYRPFQEPQYWGAFICQGDPSAIKQSI
jgi:CHAT domain-containing protein/tetratricopeptide (TPR) repeat protein